MARIQEVHALCIHAIIDSLEALMRREGRLMSEPDRGAAVSALLALLERFAGLRRLGRGRPDAR